jgi:hypothetical protein
MFCYNKVGGQAGVDLFCLVMTCRANNVEPFASLGPTPKRMAREDLFVDTDSSKPASLNQLEERRRRSVRGVFFAPRCLATGVG